MYLSQIKKKCICPKIRQSIRGGNKQRMESVTVVGRSPKVEVKAQLIIKDFLEEIVLSKPGQCRLSDPFLVGEASMVIKVYPNGFKEKSKGHVSVILYNQSDSDVSVRYQVPPSAKKKIENIKR